MTEWLFAASFQQLWFLLEALVKGFTSAAVTILLLRFFFFIEGFYYITVTCLSPCTFASHGENV